MRSMAEIWPPGEEARIAPRRARAVDDKFGILSR